MPLSLDTLRSFSHSSDGTRLWRYRTPDTLAAAAAANYFNGASGLLAVGDVILLSSSAGAGGGFQTYDVSAIGGAGVVTIRAAA